MSRKESNNDYEKVYQPQPIDKRERAERTAQRRKARSAAEKAMLHIAPPVKQERRRRVRKRIAEELIRRDPSVLRIKEGTSRPERRRIYNNGVKALTFHLQQKLGEDAYVNN